MQALSQFYETVIKRRGSDCLKYNYKKMGMPSDTLPMWIADQDFAVPTPIIEAMQHRLHHPAFGYNSAPENYFSAVADWMEKKHNHLVNQEAICVFGGIIPAIVLYLRSMLEPGDKILVQTPAYSSFLVMLKNNPYEQITNPLIYKDTNYQIDFDLFEQQIISEKVKLFILCNPHNPIGRVWTEDELKTVGEICYRHQVLIISDEIHQDLALPGYKHVPIASLDKRFQEITITCTSPSKTFNTCGLKISNILIQNPTLREAFLKTCQQYDLVSLNTFAYTAAIAAYTQCDDYLNALIQKLLQNHQLTQATLNNIPGIRVIPAQATYLCWIDCTERQLSESVLSQLLLTKGKLWLEYGSEFGLQPDDGVFIRLNLALPTKQLTEALSSFAQCFKGEI